MRFRLILHAPQARRGGFLIGDWRYQISSDGRLLAAHIVDGIVIAQETLAAHIVGPHVARPLAQLVTRHGPAIVPTVDAALEALRARLAGVDALPQRVVDAEPGTSPSRVAKTAEHARAGRVRNVHRVA